MQEQVIVQKIEQYKLLSETRSRLRSRSLTFLLFQSWMMQLRWYKLFLVLLCRRPWKRAPMFCGYKKCS